ncbi:MAG TPA: hypothetical protein VGB01_00850 [candidate division Zixibacteria bacterium]
MLYEQMIDQPIWMILVILVLSLLDYYLTTLSSNLYRKSFGQKVEYKNIKELSSENKKGLFKFDAKYLWLKVLLVLVILVIWIQAKTTELQAIKGLYFLILGFAFFNFLIINLRHLQSILISSYAARNPQQISGKVTYQRSFSLTQSAFQLLLPLILILAIFVFHPSYFLFGATLAPLFLILRNIFLAQRVKTITD